jgi:hypothetical protein
VTSLATDLPVGPQPVTRCWRSAAAALAALTLLPLTACSGGLDTEEVRYSIDQPLAASSEFGASNVTVD